MAIQRIDVPGAGHMEVLVLGAGNDLQLSFDPAAAGFSRNGEDLTVTFENGGQVVVQGFFQGDSQGALPDIFLADGSTIGGADFLKGVNPEMDSTTAAGPATGRGGDGGGVGEYADNAGDILSGVDRLGSLGTDHWGRETGFPDTPLQALIAAAAGGEAPGPAPAPGPGLDPGPGPGPGPEPQSGYIARAVVYITQSGAKDLVHFHMLDAGGNPVPPGSGMGIGAVSEKGLVDVGSLAYDPVAGAFTFELSGECLTALAAALADAGGDHGAVANLYDYITFTWDGREYTMQVVINSSGVYTPADANAEKAPAQDFYGEWHAETDGTGRGVRETGDGHDEVWYANAYDPLSPADGNALHAGRLDTGRGNDIVHVDGHMLADGDGGNIVRLGDGDNLFDMRGNIITNGGGATNEIYGGADRDRVKVDGNLINRGPDETSINTGAGKGDSIHITGKISSSGANGTTSLTTEGKIFVDNGMTTAARDASATLTGNDGVRVEVLGGSGSAYTMAATTGGKNFVAASDDGAAIDVLAKSDSFAAALYAKEGANQVRGDGDGGSIAITASGSGTAYAMGTWSGTNTVIGGKGTEIFVTAEQSGGNKSAAAMVATSAGPGKSEGVNLVQGGEKSVITLRGETGRDGSGIVYAKSGYGMWAIDKSENTVLAGKDAEVFIDAIGDHTACGMLVNDKGLNTVSGEEGVDIHITANSRLTAEGLSSYGEGTNTVETQGGDITIAASVAKGAADSTAAAILGTDGWNVVNAHGGAIYIKADAGGILNSGENYSDAWGVYSRGDGTGNTVTTVGDTISITVGNAANTEGVSVLSGAESKVTAMDGAVKIIATSNGFKDSGLVGYEPTSTSYGMQANQGGQNIISADTVEITATSADLPADHPEWTSYAYGMYAYRSLPEVFAPGANEINAHNVEIEARGQTGAYGMYAEYTGDTNTIKALDDTGITVVITARSPGEAIAMYALTKGAVNTIEGSASGENSFTLTGDLLAESGGLNQIVGGGEKDEVSVTGDITATGTGANTITTGAGNDVIILEGKVTGTLTVNAGADYDTLELRAANAGEFTTLYEAWLTQLFAANGEKFAAMSVEKLVIALAEGFVPADMAWFFNFLDAYDATDIDIAVTVGGVPVDPGAYFGGAGFSAAAFGFGEVFVDDDLPLTLSGPNIADVADVVDIVDAADVTDGAVAPLHGPDALRGLSDVLPDLTEALDAGGFPDIADIVGLADTASQSRGEELLAASALPTDNAACPHEGSDAASLEYLLNFM